jgi:WXXGXW repeat (2 copies)
MSKYTLIVLAGLVVAVSLSGAGCTVTERPGDVVVREDPFVVREAPPPPREEIIREAPSPRHEWVPGYWAWHGGWVWEDGRWVLRPHPAARWVPGHWSRRDNGWVWTSGHWR